MTTPAALRELAACPFCGGKVMFRKALFVSDGCTDAIIHAEPNNCGMTDFTTYTTDESVITAWNTRTQLRTAAAEGGEAGLTKGSPEKNAHDAIEGVAAWLMHRFGANTPEAKHAQLIIDVLPHLHPPTDSGAGRDGVRTLNEAIWKDADRYRFLRDDAQYSEGWVPHVLSQAHMAGHAPEYLAEEELDAAIDTAIAGAAGEGNKQETPRQ